ncbi:MAG TPA: flagellar type III secretion system pore protein FliP [Patescibacteria group bacterium]|nr:flagellar type III secretion system pore protein FliP [Patescibacteria group bacterium]
MSFGTTIVLVAWKGTFKRICLPLIAKYNSVMRIFATFLKRFVLPCLLLFFVAGISFAQETGSVALPQISVGVGAASSPQEFSTQIQILTLLTVLTLAPSILIMMTCFTRIVIVFHFLKQALGTQSQPPAQLLTGLALFLTFFAMQNVFDKANQDGLQPYLREEITQSQAMDNMVAPFKTFMLKHTREEDLRLFIRLSGKDKPADLNEVSIMTIIPAYSISELRVAFQIGFILFIPFLVIDMIISSILMSLGMMLLPPQLISLPVKLLLFILVDGWNLVVSSLMQSIMN